MSFLAHHGAVAYDIFGSRLRTGIGTLWQRIPSNLRQTMRLSVIRAPARSGARPSSPGGPVYIAGVLGGASELGWSARLMQKLAGEAGLPVGEIDIGHAFWAAGRRRDRPRATGPGTLLVHLGPDQLAYGLSYLESEVLADKFIIGYCPWDLEQLPTNVARQVALLDEIWVPSHFTRRAFQAAGVSRPIRVIPYILEVPAAVHADRKRFGLDEDSFIVAAVANLRSGFARKNPLAAISAFQRAFSHHERVTLALKITKADLVSAGYARLRKIAGQDPRIKLISRDVADDDMWRFLASADVVLSLHRAEGFGLTLAQGMLLGRPVVATAWSGNLDFMPQSASCLVPSRLIPVEGPDKIKDGKGQVWASPDVPAAADILRRLHGDPNLRLILGEAGRQAVRRFMQHHRLRLLGELRNWLAEPREPSRGLTPGDRRAG
ncbi:glycosyltransferase family 4 protein [Chelatococcus asaccharovorans]|uniref:Glycosyl transferase family 1 n=1 Tax=Chelatococcus asaccharovorans TaxID=28210 RepID=A0A2V3U7T8_9HYPH|nr:glycosyltransferase family 4 protein [Chelatococcus asaccharovorans]MBS7705898.1 glycosyltransferase family 4 protein [Chelatococcus asaccharovorans]PXW58919.1 glycosyl transferase family 1 [Chelatococcus asaccharovorans]CAH1658669.1 Glycosyl transferase family 1 [Chelatococcus asaccharovorans]CAH1684437.1 Glycosyl transferase family 1 [Chelatococcus asaccharovorans]